MKQLTEISSTELAVTYRYISEMGKVQEDVVRFINDCFNTCVRKITVDLNDCRIYFIFDNPHWSLGQMQDAMRGRTDFEVVWNKKDYKILWKRKQTASSYHGTTTLDELREYHRSHPASLMEVSDPTWEIDEIIPD